MVYETVDDLVSQIKSMPYPQRLDPDYDGSCPCFGVNLTIGCAELFIHGKCWRVSATHGLQDLHIVGDLDSHELEVIGEALKKQLDGQNWYNSYRVVYDR